jgi:hypothetical protein
MPKQIKFLKNNPELNREELLTRIKELEDKLEDFKCAATCAETLLSSLKYEEMPDQDVITELTETLFDLGYKP